MRMVAWMEDQVNDWAENASIQDKSLFKDE